VSTRRSRRKRSRARHVRERMKEFLRALAKGGEWSVLFLGLVGCLAGALITFVSGDTTYAVLLLLLGLIMGAALWKQEVT
jgi:uncharacterized membrane protein HdeD (DUF308 family)